MVSLEDIPAEVRWEIAAKAASAIPLAYDMVFREVLGDKYDEIERPIYTEAGKAMKGLVAALGLPTDNARDLGDIKILLTILYGPECKVGMVEGTEDRAVVKVTGCAVLNQALDMGLDPKVVCLAACRTEGESVIENLNPKYTQRFTRNMCAGDPYCEIVIELKG